jgi:hypothetical protein
MQLFNIKERPKCRKHIIMQGLKPYPNADSWIKWYAWNSAGKRVIISGGLSKQMRKMIQEGYFNPS